LNERVYNNGIDRLRSAERTERMEIERVVDICLSNKKITSVLDVGTGSGLFAEAFHKRNIKAAGVDLNPDMIEAAKKHLPDTMFKVAGAENLPFEDNSFDIVFFGVVFHEVDDYKIALTEATRVAYKEVYLLEWEYKEEEFGPPLNHRVSKKFIEDLASSVGFTSCSVIKLKNLVLYRLIK
jgi:ubiquinone/menaquinone biosynthesis C-methylase UbiE